MQFMAPLMMGQMALQGGQQLASSTGGLFSGINSLVNTPRQINLQKYEFQQQQLKMLQSKNDKQQLQNYMSGLEQFASGSNQNSQFNATSNGSALADVQWQSLMNEMSAINRMQQQGASSRDLRQYTSRNSFLDLSGRAQTSAQQEESFVDSMQRNRAQALQVLQQSRDAFDYKYTTGIQEENRKLKSSDISLNLQRSRANTERNSSGISLDLQRTTPNMTVLAYLWHCKGAGQTRNAEVLTYLWNCNAAEPTQKYQPITLNKVYTNNFPVCTI